MIHAGLSKIAASQNGALHVCLAKIGAVKVAFIKVAALKHGVSQLLASPPAGLERN